MPAVVVALASTLVPGVVAAQQRPQTPATQPAQAHPPPPPFPMSAARYEASITKTLTHFRTMQPVGPITRGDLNVLVLRLRECATVVEADGWVTRREALSCNGVMRAYISQRRREIMLSSGPDQWKRWAQQVKPAAGGN